MDLAEAVHLAMRVKVAGAEAAGEALSAEERRRAVTIADKLSVPLLSRAWQMLLKGLEEIGKAPRPGAAAEMVLIRLAYTADLPSPDELIRTMGGGAVSNARADTVPRGETPPAVHAAPVAQAAPVTHTEEEPPPVQSFDDYIMDVDPEREAELEDEDAPRAAPSLPVLRPLRTFQDVVDLVSEKRDAKLKYHLEDHVSPREVRPAGQHRDVLARPGAEGTAQRPAREAQQVDRSALDGGRQQGARTDALGQVRRAQEAQEMQEIQRHPAVEAVLKEFPGAQIKLNRLPGMKKTRPERDERTDAFAYRSCFASRTSGARAGSLPRAVKVPGRLAFGAPPGMQIWIGMAHTRRGHIETTRRPRWTS